MERDRERRSCDVMVINLKGHGETSKFINEAISISHGKNILEKGMHLAILLLGIDGYSGTLGSLIFV